MFSESTFCDNFYFEISSKWLLRVFIQRITLSVEIFKDFKGLNRLKSRQNLTTIKMGYERQRSTMPKKMSSTIFVLGGNQ